MKTRTLVLAALLAGGFLYFTSQKHWSLRRIFQPLQTSAAPCGPARSPPAPA